MDARQKIKIIPVENGYVIEVFITMEHWPKTYIATDANGLCKVIYDITMGKKGENDEDSKKECDSGMSGMQMRHEGHFPKT